MDHLTLLEHAEDQLNRVIRGLDEAELDAGHQLPAVDGPPPGQPRPEEPAVLGRHGHRPAADGAGGVDGRGAVRR